MSSSDTGPPSAEEAARKAREIAAKLLGTPSVATGSTSDTNGGGTNKRKRWGVAAPAPAPTTTTAGASSALPGWDQVAKKLKQENQPAQRRVWVTNTTKDRPAWHFVTYMSPQFEEVITKAKKEAGVAEQDDNAAANNNKTEIKFKGRGSSRQPALPGIPEEPLHIFIEGPKEVAEAAETLVEELLQEAEKAEVTIDVTQEEEFQNDPSLAQAAANSMNDQQLALMGGGGFGGAGHASYRPATVAQLIGQHHQAANAGGNVPPMEQWESEEVHVPNGVVGFVIGRGGETITSMQARTGAKVQIQKEHELQPGQTMRIITVSAPTREGLDQCKTMITSMVEERVRASGGGGMHHGGGGGGGGGFHRSNSSNSGASGGKDAKVQQALDQGHVLKTVEVPDNDVGLIIGKGGSTIQMIQERTGAQVQIPPSAAPGSDVRVISVTHPSEQGAQQCAAMITDIVTNKKTHNNNNNQNHGAQTTIQVFIPDKDVGLCIGRQGCVIKEMQNKSKTRIQIPGQPTPGQPHRIATVSGPPEACEQVRQLIERIVMEQSSACVMSGTGGGGGAGGYQQQQNQYGGGYNQGGYQQQQQQQQQQGGDYSAEWAAYYAAQAVAQAQQAAPAPAPTPAPAAAAGAPAPASDAYYEEFFRYSYYYGEPAARQYYGTWSPPEGTPNPYGVNPDGITAAPASSGQPQAAAAPAPAPPAAAPAPAPVVAPGNARDTSVRKVSNLPAWMTRQQG